jgi:hypothetical protein
MAKPIFDTCHICGELKKMSFEHVPPEAAFNDQRIIRTAFLEMLAAENLDELKGKYQQRGAGAYTLCEKCNSDTGAWYADAYARWARQAMAYVISTRGRPSLQLPYNLFPLRVLKQVVCMFFSVNGSHFQKGQADLVRFVLNKEMKFFPSHVRVLAFYTFSDRSRSVGTTAVVHGMGSSQSKMHVLSEVTFPPFGFVMTMDSCPPPGTHFCDMSSFCEFEYRDFRFGIPMKLPLMPIYTGFPGDYRTREQTIADYERNKRIEAQIRASERLEVE